MALTQELQKNEIREGFNCRCNFVFGSQGPPLLSSATAAAVGSFSPTGWDLSELLSVVVISFLTIPLSSLAPRGSVRIPPPDAWRGRRGRHTSLHRGASPHTVGRRRRRRRRCCFLPFAAYWGGPASSWANACRRRRRRRRRRRFAAVELG